MDGKDLFRLLDLVIELEKEAKKLEEGSEETIEPKKSASLKGKASAYKDAGEKLMKLLRELNSCATSQMDWEAIKKAIENEKKGGKPLTGHGQGGCHGTRRDTKGRCV